MYFRDPGSEFQIPCSVDTGVLMCSYRGENGDVNSLLQLCPGVNTDEFVLSLGPSVGNGCVDGDFDVVPACAPWTW